MRLNNLNQLIRNSQAIDGTWRLDGRHRLTYRRRMGEKEVLLIAEPIAAAPTGLVIRVQEKTQEGGLSVPLLSVTGKCQADDSNRLSLLVERQNGQHDWLTLQGRWEIGDDQEVIYRYETNRLKTKRPEVHSLSFRGYWDFSERNRLAYVLDSGSDSAFRFRGAFQTPSILAKEGAIRYQVGVELEGKRCLNTVTLFGKWKLSRDLALSFEVVYGDGSTRAMTFGATYSMGSDQTVSAQLTVREGREPLGCEVVFTREFLNRQGEAFVRLRKSFEETAVEGGLRFRW